jgi:hypothetical protein
METAGTDPGGFKRINAKVEPPADTTAAASAQEQSPYREALATLQAWRTDLSARIARARLRYEAVGVGREEIIALAGEAREFRETVLWLRGKFQ